MVVSTVLTDEAYYSLVRYCPDPARNESRNIGVLVIWGTRHAVFRAAPLSRVTPKLHEQGLLDSILVTFGMRLKNGELSDVGQLERVSALLRGPIQLTSPARMAVVGSFEKTAEALYQSLVAIRQRRGPGLGRGELLDQVVDIFRSKGAQVARGSYLGDFIFDAIVRGVDDTPTALGVVSYDTPAEDWAASERQVGHFLFAVDRAKPHSAYVVQPPTNISTDAARVSHERVARWLADAGVPTVASTEIRALASNIAGGQLWLSGV